MCNPAGVLLASGLKPVGFLIDADCQTRTLTWYALDEPETPIPARNLFGEPVKVADGRTYRRFNPHLDAPPEEMHEYCGTDWTKEREAVGKSVFGK